MAFRLEEDLGFLIARTHWAMRRWLMSQLEPLGLTYEQFRVLNALCEEDTVSQVALAGRANMDVTSLARMLERLENAGLIQRETSPDDSRINLVVLTENARRLAAQFTPIRTFGLEAATEGLSAKEVVEFRRMLNVVFENMSR
jgi:DNA-binding MarR family transcriptional regulator